MTKTRICCCLFERDSAAFWRLVDLRLIRFLAVFLWAFSQRLFLGFTSINCLSGSTIPPDKPTSPSSVIQDDDIFYGQNSKKPDVGLALWG